MAEINTQLRQAHRLIQTGDKQRALNILLTIVSTNPDNPMGWWLFANATQSRNQKIRALENVIRLEPDHSQAKTMLEKLLVLDVNRFNKLPTADDSHDPFVGTPSAPRYDYGPHDEYANYPPAFSQKAYASPPKVVVVKPPHSRTLPIILVLFGLMVLCGCGMCFVVSMSSAALIFDGIRENMTLAPDGGVSIRFGNFALPDDLPIRGMLEPGQTVSGAVGSVAREEEGWLLAGEAGRRIIIQLNAVGNAFDPELFLYDSGGNLVDRNDDVDYETGNRNSLIDIRLPQDDTYTIRVRAVGRGGDYELTVRGAER